jgi:hypothetical protein
MTRLRIYATSDPQAQRGPIQPMSRDDAEFWRLRQERNEPRPQGLWRRIFRRDT